MDFKNITKQVLDGHGFSQAQLAKVIGVSPGRISQLVLKGGSLKYEAGLKLMSLFGALPDGKRSRAAEATETTA